MNGMVALYLSATVFAVGAVFVKIAANGYGGMAVSAARFAVGALLCVGTLLARGVSLKPVNARAVLMRGLFGAVSMALSYLAVALTGPGRVSVLGNLYPIFIPVFGSIFFGERFQRGTLPSMVLCTAGVLAVMGDGSGANLTGDVLALGSALFASVAVNLVRRAAATDDPVMIYLSPSLFGLVVFAFVKPPAAYPGHIATVAMLGSGVIAFVAQLLMGYGYRHVPAGRGSLVFFWETALTVLLGAVFTGERLNFKFGIGLSLILAGLYLNRQRAEAQA